MGEGVSLMKKIIIIGGGIAGLTAGIYAQKFGYESVVYEGHHIVGGECTGWTREGFHIDNCIHWMTGTKKNTDLYDIWREIGAIDDDTEILMSDSFYTSYADGKKLKLYYDTEKTRRELIAISPEDEKEINNFIKAVRITQKLQLPVDMPIDMMPKLKVAWLGLTMLKAMKPMKKYGAVTIGDYLKTFKSPAIRAFISDYMPLGFCVFALIASYAIFSGNNGGIPKGGSVKMAARVAERYKSLGGKIYTSSRVSEINIENGHATGITLDDGTVVNSDYVVPTCDPSITFGKLMDKKYMPKELKKRYDTMPVNTQFQVAFGVDDDCKFLDLCQYFDCEPFMISDTEIRRIGIRNYNYEPSFAPEGKAVLQTYIWQKEEDYDYWEKLYKEDRDAYRNEKKRLSNEILKRIIKQYPQLDGKIRVIDAYTPYTYNRYIGAYKGGYMNFVYNPDSVMEPMLTGIIEGVDNVLLGTQWLQLPGGLPCAASCGKFAIQRIDRIISKGKQKSEV